MTRPSTTTSGRRSWTARHAVPARRCPAAVPGEVCVPRMITATLAASGPIASTPADIVRACADMFLLPNALPAGLANSALVSAPARGAIMAAARSIDEVGLCGRERRRRLGDAAGDAGHLGDVVPQRAVGPRPLRVADEHRGHQRGGGRPTTARPQPRPSSSVPTVTRSRRASTKLTSIPWTTSTHSTEHTATHHSGQPSAMPT